MDEIFKLKPSAVASILSCLSAAFSIVCLIYVYSPTTFEELDIWKLIILSIGFACPIMMFNSFIIFIVLQNDPVVKDTQTAFALIPSIAGIFSTLILFFVILFAFLFKIQNFYYMFIPFFISEFVFIGLIAQFMKSDSKTEEGSN